MKVSVIIPVFNGEKYIAEAIESCLIQEEVGEVILVDDGSIDKTLDILKSYEKQDSRIVVLQFETNTGVSNARNAGIIYASCELISFLDSDDYFLENRFLSTVKLLDDNPLIDGTYEAVQNFIEENATYSSEFERTVISLDEDVKPENLADFVMKDNKPFFSIISLVLRTKRLRCCNILFDEALEMGEDIDFIYALARKMSLIKIVGGEIVVFRRLHGSNVTASNTNTIKMRKLILEKWFNLGIQGHLSAYQFFLMLYRKTSYDLIKYKNKGIFIKIYFIVLEIIKKPISIKRLLGC